MLLTTPQRRVALDNTNISLYINNEIVPSSDCEKLLGVFVSSSLDWSDHISYVCRCINYRLYVLRKIKSFLTPKARAIYCNSYVLPYLDYCNTVWGNTTQYNIMRVLRLQKYAVRLAFDNFESRSAALMEKINWLPFQYRINYNKLLLVFKALNGHAPGYISDMFVHSHNANYCLRSQSLNKLNVPKPKSELLRYCLSYSGAKLWNSLPTELTQCVSPVHFKKLLYKYLNSKWHTDFPNDHN